MAINDEDVAQIISMGFPASQAREALVVSNGNLEMAVNYLLMGGSVGDGGGGGGGYGAAAAASSSSSPLVAAAATSSTPLEDSKPTAISATSDETISAANKMVEKGGLIQCSISQYSVEDGRSACTCMALTAASQFLQDQNVSSEFLQQMVTLGVQNYQQMSFSGSLQVEHLSAEEVLNYDASQANSNRLFHVQSLPGGIRQGVLSHDFCHPLGMKSLLEGIRQEERSEWMAILMTKSPETVLLCFPPETGDNLRTASYWLIDSHPRPQLGVPSAYAKLHASLDTLLLSLEAIFPCTDLGPDVPEMMAMMYNSFDLYPLVRKK